MHSRTNTSLSSLHNEYLVSNQAEHLWKYQTTAAQTL